ncbi:MAG TPA: penicillin-binding protein 1C, partial [Deltaproteobacteria bacterium]|nr:penicillin-binding protein 1C [Deltaproteobacteria bacterium]
VFAVRQETRYRRTRIVYPSSDTLIAMDPDIPDELQRVPLRFEGEGRQYEWVIDGDRTGVFSKLLLWKPRLGTHEVSIVDGSNQVIDSVTFAVR